MMPGSAPPAKAEGGDSMARAPMMEDDGEWNRGNGSIWDSRFSEGKSRGTNSNLSSGGTRLNLAKVRDTSNTRGFDWTKDKSDADRLSEQMTEWDEALIKHGIRDDPRVAMRAADAQLKAAVESAVASYDPLEKATIEQLDEMEDDEDEDVLASYRKKRMAEMKAARAAARFGSVLHIREDEYRVEVSDEAAPDRDTYVVVHLFRDTMTACVLINRALGDLAARFPATKFVKIFATDANKDYPDSKLPTVLVYHKGEIATQMVGLHEFGGSKVSNDHVEWRLAACGAISGSDIMEGDSPFLES